MPQIIYVMLVTNLFESKLFGNEKYSNIHFLYWNKKQ